MLCITCLFTGCKKEEIGPDFYGTTEKNLSGVKQTVEDRIGTRPGPFTKVFLPNGDYYFTQEQVLNDKIVRYLRSLKKEDWVWDGSLIGGFKAPVPAELSDKDGRKRYFYIGNVYYGFSGRFDKGMAIIQEEGSSSSYLAEYF